MPKVFISYRRDDAAGYAGRLYEALERRLGANVVFRDVDTLAPGQDFVDAIDARLRECRVFLALIGREWLDTRDAAGRRRIDHPQDYVRLEVAGALARPSVRIIPVLIEGATMPAPDRLPDDIRALARRHAISLRDDAWDHDVNRLAAAIGVDAPRRDDRGPSPVVIAWPRRWMRRAAAALVVLVLAAAAWLASRDRDGAEPPAAGDAPAQAETVTRTRTSGRTATAPADEDATAGPSSRPPYAIPIPPIAEAVHGRLVYTLLSAAVAPFDARTSQLRLTIRFSNEGRYDANAWDSSFRLLADGRTLVPTSGLNELVSSNSQIDRIVTFTMPSDTRRAIFRILDPEAELPLDVTPTGPPAPEGRNGSDDAPSRAVTRELIAEPHQIVGTSDGSLTVERASSRRFVNALRLRFSFRMINTGRYPGGFPQVRLAAGGRLIAPIESPSLVVLPDSDGDAEVDFDAPPDATRAVLRVTIGDRTEELPLELQ